jgi:hypothetical protein
MSCFLLFERPSTPIHLDARNAGAVVNNGYAGRRNWYGLCLGRDMNGKMTSSNARFSVAVCARGNGKYIFQIFTVTAEPQTFLSDDTTYCSPEEAERAGYKALEALARQT